mmetsp:Transcript_5276/g.13184  ORF Transcript_5276/g.13184 Transcript_5276/m.13184 type:complete len:506 (-) Transcript_5276:429-1946(-)|eukprot:CAMPEP_0181104270 /NCGR_PEP_ID=MMETSP1071-20121207/15330_1 /TAXON_ID=35127 /ORGANISM="Thalassiosira sp., Strain NH16" /LENGTH=505 /DNA_ID=CAMNT_0023187441 /DNA_START=8 /DNA_END=1525 /DNA_ORIENTATION=-
MAQQSKPSSINDCEGFLRWRHTSSNIGVYDDRDHFNGDDGRKPVHYWMPPPVDGDDEDEPLQVDFRCACFKLTNVSTVDFTAMVKFVLIFEWNDPRLCGMPITTNDLPGDLWGPDIVLENAQNDTEIFYDSFSLLDSATGRLKRTVVFHGPVYNPMSLKGFPFDHDELEMKFISICNWRTLDGSRYGNDPVKQIYKLEPMLDLKDVDFFFLGWGGKVPEFTIIGWSHDVQNTVLEPSKPIIFKFDIHLIRKAQFYYLKILLPLWLLVLTSSATYAIETDDLPSRLEVLVTLLLSTIAFLYIIQESIPKMSHLTVIDRVVLASLVSLVLAVLFSVIISILPNHKTLNWVLAVVNQLLYWIANAMLVGPPHYRWKKHIAEMEARQATRQLTTSGQIKPGLVRSSKNVLTNSQLRFAINRTRTQRSYSLTAKGNIQGDYDSEKSQNLGFNRISLLRQRKEKLKREGDNTHEVTNQMPEFGEDEDVPSHIDSSRNSAGMFSISENCDDC